jgi:hypothetical protein
MIRESVERFSEKIMGKQVVRARYNLNAVARAPISHQQIGQMRA